jgi:hypothetical protein
LAGFLLSRLTAKARTLRDKSFRATLRLSVFAVKLGNEILLQDADTAAL